ncbi:endothelin-1 [Oxyura jamaicensis]|uniref:endothelin-1 n=1 Tax=Oxyura jamaicensis TaxID=8884 RepID=UPI0015A6166B|nr:endothelin-1 [Oxyura jamaicensis]
MAAANPTPHTPLGPEGAGARPSPGIRRDTSAMPRPLSVAQQRPVWPNAAQYCPARPGAPRPAPPPTSRSEICRRFPPRAGLISGRTVTNSGTTLSRDKIEPGLFTRSMGVRYKRAPGTTAPARRAGPPQAAACSRRLLSPPALAASALRPAAATAFSSVSFSLLYLFFFFFFLPKKKKKRFSLSFASAMDYSHVVLPLLFVLCPGLLPAAPGAEVGSAPPPPAVLHRRSRRCSCSSLLDEECVYFCHLDIIWINTPEKTVPYGLGGPSRSRRSLKDMVPEMLTEASSRCQCANQKDRKCLNFCQTGKDLWAQSTVEKTLCHCNKGGNCIGPKCMNQQFVDSRKSNRLEAIGNSIKASFSIAKLKAELQKGWKLKHNRRNKRRSIWESLKTS